jgi:hypothetical protein
MIEQDERRGVPSASAMERVVNCPPSHHLAKLLPREREEEVGEDAKSGTRIHAVLANDVSEDTLSAAEHETMEMCRAAVKKLANEYGITEAAEAIFETRLGLTTLDRVVPVAKNRTAQFKFTGQGDLILIENDRALVIDYKTGRGDQKDAVNNAQLAALAALVWRWRGCREIRVAIVQPWAGQPTVADYDYETGQKAYEWLLAAVDAAERSTPDDRKAGEWCKWCRVAKAGKCDVANRKALAVVDVMQPQTLVSLPDETQRAAMFARAMEMPAEALASTLHSIAFAKRIIAALEGAAKERAKSDPDFQRFYTLREKNGRRKITDVGQAFARANGYGVTPEAFTAQCSIGLGDLEDLLRSATGKKGKDLKALTGTVLDGITETGAPSYELQPVESIQ